MIEPTLAAYMAGFVDGEGHISTSRVKTAPHCLVVVIVNTVETPLRLIQSKFGGTVLKRRPRNERCKPSFVWRVWAKKAEAFLVAIQPYVIVKAEHVRLGLLLRNGRVLGRGPYRYKQVKLDEIEIKRREEIAQEFKRINHRGP
jgi:hypothetical protein